MLLMVYCPLNHLISQAIRFRIRSFQHGAEVRLSIVVKCKIPQPAYIGSLLVLA